MPVLSKAEAQVIGMLRVVVVDGFYDLLYASDHWGDLDPLPFTSELHYLVGGIVEDLVTDELLMELYESKIDDAFNPYHVWNVAEEYILENKMVWVEFVKQYVIDMSPTESDDVIRWTEVIPDQIVVL